MIRKFHKAFAWAVILLGVQPVNGAPHSDSYLKAEDCPYVNLSDPGQPLEKIHPFNQEDSEICYAVSAATLMTVSLQNHEPGFEGWTREDAISPVDVAFQYIVQSQKEAPDSSYRSVNSKDRHEEGGGFVCDAYSAMKKAGACKERILSELFRSDDFNSKFFEDMRTKLEKLWEEDRGTASYEENLNTINQIVEGVESLETLDLEFDKIYSENGSAVLKDMQSFRAIINSACGPRADLSSIPDCTSHYFDTAAELFSARQKKKIIDENFFSQPKRAVGIGYCSEVLLNRTHRGVVIKEDSKTQYHCSDDTEGHYSTLIGQRWNSYPQDGSAPRCEYLIRNSWKRRAYKYDPSWEWGDNQMDIWVDSKTLMLNTNEIFDLNP